MLPPGRPCAAVQEHGRQQNEYIKEPKREINMPLGALAEGIFSTILECILQIVLEGMIKGAGYVILRSGYFILRHILQLDRNDDLRELESNNCSINLNAFLGSYLKVYFSVC
ncbi:MAG: hypothetical protein D3904_12030 [Candidatus Electrothrix sp. EH2]|nr:hypothetical protein [Candidatus Electrothrix sp. EH2]